jgi:hypothetical protein
MHGPAKTRQPPGGQRKELLMIGHGLMRRRLTTTLVALGMAGASAMLGTATAHAASDYNGAVYQVELSLNCTKPGAPCQNIFGLGGIWGWIALMPGDSTNTWGTGNAQITDCGHAGAGGGGAGAGHMSYDPTWYLFTSPTPPSPITPKDPNNRYLYISGSPDGSAEPFIVPATYGHYSLTFMGAFGQETLAP